jgi:thiol-disulfide isomerase/thioredoxin
MKLFSKALPNAVTVVDILIKDLGIKVNSFTIKKDLLEHPDYPNMLALSDCLTTWNVPNEAFRMEKNINKLRELTFPFIAHLNTEGGQYAVIHEIKYGEVIFSNEKENTGFLPLVDFFERWDGIILYAEKDVLSGEKGYYQSLIKGWLNQTRLPFLVSILLIGIAYKISTTDLNLSYLMLIVLKLLGTFISCILLMQSVNATNPFIANLCSLGKRNDCNAILKSNASKVTSWLNWSEVGLFYFAGTFLCLLFIPSTVRMLSWFNILSLPYTIYSIGYQIKIKNWCILCCSIQTILWLEAVAFYGIEFPIQVNWENNLFSILLCLLLPVAIWSFLKPFLLDAGQVRPLKRQLKTFKYNEEIFNQLLSSQKRYTIPDDLMPIILGNPNAKTIITMVSNPFCGPCAKAHEILDEWINKLDDIQLKIVFATANDDNDHRTKVARHVTALSLLPDKQIAREALNDWYTQKSKKYVKWAEKYPVVLNGLDVITEKQKEWCDMAEISSTPTILINGYKLVGPYDLSDIKYFLAI